MSETAPSPTPKFHLTVGHFRKTQEGLALITEERPFMLGGRIWQGYRGTVAEAIESQMSEEELTACHDVDGSRPRILSVRRERLKAREYAKSAELEQRRAKERAALRDELELKKLQREMGVEPGAEPETELPGPDPRLEMVGCPECGKEMQRKRLHMHRMGAHVNKAKRRAKEVAQP